MLLRISKKKILLVVAAALVLGLVLLKLVEREIENRLEEQFLGEITYESLEVSLIQNHLLLGGIESSQKDVVFQASEIRIEGLSYLNYLRDGNIQISSLVLKEPEVILNAPQTDTTSSSLELDLEISVEEFETDNGQLLILKDSTEILRLSFESLELQRVELDSTSIKSQLPFRFSAYEVQEASLQAELDERHNLSLGSLNASDGNFLIRDFAVIPKYDKQEFQEYVPYELDRYDLKVNEIGLDNLSFGFDNDSLVLQNKLLKVSGADLEVYRDKLQPDDTRRKPMYSEQLRNLPIKLDFKETEIRESRIVYLERLDADREPARVSFNGLRGSIKNLRNTGLEGPNFPDTEIHAEARFMDDAPVTVDWSFNVGDSAERFRIYGSFEGLSAAGINSFLSPAMGVEAQGGINFLAFDFSGNEETATGEMQLTYEDFEVDVLRDDGDKKDGFLSAIANLFVNSEALSDSISHEDLQVERVKSKSFWNYLWRCIREGALASFL